MEELRRIREERGLSQQGLSDASGVNKATINQIERGRRSPNVDTLAKLADALGVEVGDFFPKAQSRLPLSFEGAGGRDVFDFGEARECLEGYCERWERLLAADELDDRAVEEFFATGVGWIPVMDIALRAELNELRMTTGLKGDELLARSEMARANRRYLDVFSSFVKVLRRTHGEIPAEPIPAETNVIRLQEVRDRLVGMGNEAVG